MICMIWFFVYATLSGSLLKVFLYLQCKITEKITKDQFLRCHLLHIVLKEETVSQLYLEGVELFGIFVAYYYLMR